MTRPTHAVHALLSPLALCAALGAQGFQEDWVLTDPLVEIDTDDTTITTVSGRQFRIRNGIFVFRGVFVSANTTLRVRGSNPLIVLASQRIRVDGRIVADGEDGERTVTLNSPQFPTQGGDGGPGAGRGGNGSPVTNDRSPTGEAGHGPGNLPGLGGRGGLLSCTSACGRGSGGGGGSFGTVGDVAYLLGTQPWVQVTGVGGFGCFTRTLSGGAAGPSPFGDGLVGNDFWGIGYDVHSRRIIVGELAGPIGGSGGGGGGDRAPSCQIPDPIGFRSDNVGGAGGGGGGAVVLVSAGVVEVGPIGEIRANGGHGGGGEQAGSNNQAGGGGGGSGGMIVLAAGQGIRLHVRGGTYANELDTDFTLSADGGIGTQGRFGGQEFLSKYPIGSPSWASKPAGGFGGLGLIQLVAPVADNRDGTNTVLDDNVELIRDGRTLNGVEKAQALGWRGYPDQTGRRVDDFGLPTDDRNGMGEMRPSPVLLPYFR